MSRFYIETNPLYFPLKLKVGIDEKEKPVYKTFSCKPKFQHWAKSNEVKLLK